VSRGKPPSVAGLPNHTLDGDDGEMLTVEEAAAILKVKPSTVRHWVREERMPAVRLGPRATRFTRPLLRQFVKQNLTGSSPASECHAEGSRR
jgi:excisionase family DNA binding protein